MPLLKIFHIFFLPLYKDVFFSFLPLFSPKGYVYVFIEEITQGGRDSGRK